MLRREDTSEMRLEKGGQPITCLEDWRLLAPPKSDHQWVEGRSAFELANAWCGSGVPVVPVEVRALLDSADATRHLVLDRVLPEHRIPFDKHGGEPRNADLAFIGTRGPSRVAVTIEAKADEPFGASVETTVADALERLVANPRSRGVQRVADLVTALFGVRLKGQPHAGSLRYQLLTAAAGSLAFAQQEGASTAVLIVHEFITNRTRDELHQRNADDLMSFVNRLSGTAIGRTDIGCLWGPYSVPGHPLFENAPALLVGKVSSMRRKVGA